MVISMLSIIAHLGVVTPPNPTIFSKFTFIQVNLNQNVCDIWKFWQFFNYLKSLCLNFYDGALMLGTVYPNSLTQVQPLM